MLILKEINLNDIDKEYKAIKSIPENENGFENKYYNVTKEQFEKKIVPKLINNSKGIDLPDGYVPSTYYFLWDDDEIVGLFKIRHFLNDFLRNGSGHIGYTILAEHRNRGYATMGLKLAIEKCKKIIAEDEIYLSVLKDNNASLKVQLKCGAYKAGETETDYLMRIKIDKNM